MINKKQKILNLFDEKEQIGSLCGIDEAGRGALAGPLVIAGVILKRDIEGLNDSKKLTKRQREALYGEIVENSYYHISLFSSYKIDSVGLSKCLKEGLEDIVNSFKAKGVSFLFDGNSNFKVFGVSTMVKADLKVKEVSASSILAKVFRDRLMDFYEKEYPEYGFSQHKGYGTKKHIEAILEFGYSPIHRKSFKIKGIK